MLETNTQFKTDESLDKSDEDLVNLSLQNSENFKYIIERYKNKLSSYIARRAKVSAEDIEDLLQDIFIKIYLNLKDFDTSLKFSSWAYRITHNEVISWYRKKSIRPQVNFEDFEEDSFINSFKDDHELSDIFKNYENTEIKENIKLAINSLSEKYKEIITLRFLEEKDYSEISDILQIPIGTVSTCVSRGKKEMQKILEKKYE